MGKNAKPRTAAPEIPANASEAFAEAFARYIEDEQAPAVIAMPDPDAVEIIEIGNGPHVKQRHRVKVSVDEIRLAGWFCPEGSAGLLYRRSESHRAGRPLFMVAVEARPDDPRPA